MKKLTMIIFICILMIFIVLFYKVNQKINTLTVELAETTGSLEQLISRVNRINDIENQDPNNTKLNIVAKDMKFEDKQGIVEFVIPNSVGDQYAIDVIYIDQGGNMSFINPKVDMNVSPNGNNFKLSFPKKNYMKLVIRIFEYDSGLFGELSWENVEDI